jgi:hypothetical protein
MAYRADDPMFRARDLLLLPSVRRGIAPAAARAVPESSGAGCGTFVRFAKTAEWRVDSPTAIQQADACANADS